MNEYVTTKARFSIWNGKDAYTVEYTPGIKTWWVFRGEETSNAIHSVAVSKPPKKKDINIEAAEEIFFDYLSNDQS